LIGSGRREHLLYCPAEVTFMPISLSPEIVQRLEDRVRNGGYPSADDVVRAALNALDELEVAKLDDATLDAIDRSEEQIEGGQVHDWADVREAVRAKFLGR
jgi:Arc/MetJ-type ribon-helix-helix transcriptional regulator